MPLATEIVIHITLEGALAILAGLSGASVPVWKWWTKRKDLAMKAEEKRRQEDREMLISHIRSETAMAPLLERVAEALEQTVETLSRWSE